MKYAEAMQIIDTEKALTYLGFTVRKNGSYLNFPCIDCGNESAIRYHGEKKNVSFCKTCKVGSNIIALAVKVKGIEFQDAKNLLIEKASYCDKPIEEQLNLNYELEWCVEMEKQGLNQELCEKLGVGKPKGKTMLSGSIAFTVFNEQGLKVAYSESKPRIDLEINPVMKGCPSFTHHLTRNCTFTITTTLPYTRKSGLRGICLTACG